MIPEDDEVTEKADSTYNMVNICCFFYMFFPLLLHISNYCWQVFYSSSILPIEFDLALLKSHSASTDKTGRHNDLYHNSDNGLIRDTALGWFARMIENPPKAVNRLISRAEEYNAEEHKNSPHQKHQQLQQSSWFGMWWDGGASAKSDGHGLLLHGLQWGHKVLLMRRNHWRIMLEMFGWDLWMNF